MVFEKNFHSLEIPQVLGVLEASEHGLSSKEAKRRLQTNGYNELPEVKRPSFLNIFWRQFQSPLIYILLASGLIVLLMREFTDAIVIFFVLFFNAVVGTIQEGRAQNAFLALRKFIKSKASVIREGKEMEISDREVVPGDIIYLREGEKIPADARLIYADTFRVNEAAITGESLPRDKKTDILKKNSLLPNQTNMVWKGTLVVGGVAKAVVTATGENTYLGKIAEETLKIETEFPLKSDFRRLSKIILKFVLAVAVSFSLLGWYWGLTFLEVFKTLVAICVSIIPEGLPIVITLVLAQGVWRMSKSNVLVKKLPAVEVLGETEVLAVDKTGTLTRNELVVKSVYCAKKEFEIGGEGYSPEGEVDLSGKIVDPLNHPELLILGKIAALSSSSNLIFRSRPKGWHVTGDPTDGALTVFSRKIGFNREDLLEEMPVLDEVPFDYDLKYHASLHKGEKKNFLAVAGSPEEILKLCKKETVFDEGKVKEKFYQMSRSGLRVIALAYSQTSLEKINDKKLPLLDFAGFLGIKDALRPEVNLAVKKVEDSGLKVVMITGDHKITAEAIATEAGIFKEGGRSLGGEELSVLTEKELAEKISDISLFFRVTPETKMKIIQAYRRKGIVVAMTGDGVNDTLSLSAADIGISMGRIGTEVAKEASDIVLLDDNFANVVSGVAEGKDILRKIKRVVLYLFSTSLGETFTILIALVIGLPLPVLAAQILWLNLVTDGFLDMALAMEPTEKTRKKIPFKKVFLLDKTAYIRMVLMALVMSIGTLIFFFLNHKNDLAKAWTFSLSLLAVFQWFNAWNCRSSKKSVFSKNLFSNKYLIGATAVVIVLQILAVYNPYLQSFLGTVPLDLSDWIFIVPAAFSIIAVEEIRKFFFRKKKAV